MGGLAKKQISKPISWILLSVSSLIACVYATKNTEGSFKQLDPIFDIHCNLPSLPLTVPPTPKRCVAHSPAFAFHAGDGKFSPFKLPASAAPAPPA